MSTAINFSAGPAMLPAEVLQRAESELSEWRDSGMSVMEMSHRGKDFMAIAEKAEADLRQVMQIGDDYKVLFLQGGATTQFSMIPMNLANGQTASYINTGAWSKKAIAEAQRICEVKIAASTEDSNFTCVPTQKEIEVDSDASYLHYTPNETIGGVEFHYIPDSGELPLVADMSSTILSRPLDVSQFGLIYAGAQKNIGPAGLTIVIIREDLLGLAPINTPSMSNYDVHAKSGSMFNTPPAYTWYVAGLVFEWIQERGGLAEMANRNRRKSSKLYHVIDESDFYNNPVRADSRSWMNIPFTLADAELDKVFLEKAEAESMYYLKGHRSVGGMRASIYNAMPEDSVDQLIEFMQQFEKQHG